MNIKAEEGSSHDANNAALLEGQITLPRQQQGWQAPGSVAASGMVASMDSGYDNDEYDELETPEREMEPATGDGAVVVKLEPDAAPLAPPSTHPSANDRQRDAHSMQAASNASGDHPSAGSNEPLSTQMSATHWAEMRPHLYPLGERMYTTERYTAEEEVRLVRMLAGDSDARLWAIGKRTQEPKAVWLDRLSRLSGRSPNGLYAKLRSLREEWRELHSKLTPRGKCTEVGVWEDQHDLSCLLAAQAEHHGQQRLILVAWQDMFVGFHRANNWTADVEASAVDRSFSRQSSRHNHSSSESSSCAMISVNTSTDGATNALPGSGNTQGAALDEAVDSPPLCEASLVRYAARDPALKAWAVMGSSDGVMVSLQRFRQLAPGPPPEILFDKLKHFSHVYHSLHAHLSPAGLSQRTDAWTNQADLALLNRQPAQIEWIRIYHDEIYIPYYEATLANRQVSSPARDRQTTATSVAIAASIRAGPPPVAGPSNSVAASAQEPSRRLSSVALLPLSIQPSSKAIRLNSGNIIEPRGSVFTLPSPEQAHQSGSHLLSSGGSMFKRDSNHTDSTGKVSWYDALGLRNQIERQERQIALLQEQTEQQQKMLERHAELLKRQEELARQP